MRDLIVVAMVVIGALAALRRPWIGVMLWTWISIMNPHRYAWGWAYNAPLAAVAAAATVLGLLMTRERASPFKGTAVTALVCFMVWMTLSWIFGLAPSTDYVEWSKVMKIDFMVLVALALLHRKQHIVALTWVAAGSLALLGAKGGLFTLLTGGDYHVWGPPGSFIEDNNEFALALVMTIPLLRFLQMQLTGFWSRHGLTLVMLLCLASVLGSQSRGSFLGLLAMGVLLWWRGKSRVAGGIVMLAATLALVAFMPELWSERMATISDYQDDRSAMGRVNAWWNAWHIAWHYPLGVGFDAARPDLFALYAPNPNDVHAAHSIYFQVLGNHGFVGLAIFLVLWIATWRSAGWLRTEASKIPEAKWCADLGAMCQVSIIGYAVGGAFLSLAYFDLPYDIMVLVVVSRAWVVTKAWEREPARIASPRVVTGSVAVPERVG